MFVFVFVFVSGAPVVVKADGLCSRERWFALVFRERWLALAGVI